MKEETLTERFVTICRNYNIPELLYIETGKEDSYPRFLTDLLKVVEERDNEVVGENLKSSTLSAHDEWVINSIKSDVRKRQKETL